MATGKRLAEFAILSVAMSTTVGLCLWVLLGLLDVFLIPKPTHAAPIPEPTTVVQMGRISKIDPRGTIVLEHLANGRAGASTVVDEFNVQDDLPVSDLKIGDNVDFTSAQVGGIWTVTKIQKQ
jgi:Cu/Ag efflux protein CusF